ncbi:hypothetical protein AMTR_s00028p00088140 [Amborella trichopoda]|uniref:Uncharacterized protein n=1 Tax=Amborella trichopoda TaxID=13333 RepID=W1PRV3_AMBTC|nr:hypothetical protein AMTR_s00028p00088140 [Amborella trichopoda]
MKEGTRGKGLFICGALVRERKVEARGENEAAKMAGNGGATVGDGNETTVSCSRVGGMKGGWVTADSAEMAERREGGKRGEGSGGDSREQVEVAETLEKGSSKVMRSCRAVVGFSREKVREIAESGEWEVAEGRTGELSDRGRRW